MSTNADWANVPLSEAVDFLDSRRRPVKVGDRAKIRGDIPYYGASGIVDYVNDYIFDESLILLGEDGENILSRAVPLAFKISGRSWVNNHAHVLRPRPEFDIDFLTQYLESLDYSTLNTGSAQPKLNKHSCSLIRVVKPPLVEQQRIARCLEDAEALIVSLERLIAKKLAIKQGMMQQLLTGRTRLPGFVGEWEVAPFKEIALPSPERLDPRTSGNGTLLVELDDIEPGTGRLLRRETVEEAVSMKSVFRPGDVLFGKLRAYLRKFWLADSSGLCSTEIWVLRTQGHHSPKFIRYLVESDSFIEMASNAHGTHMPRADWSLLSRFEIAIPPPDEQLAIANVLFDADLEIEVLQRRLDKARNIKTGMMQQLLTGRVRLPVDAGS